MDQPLTQRAIHRDHPALLVAARVIIYLLLIALALFTLIPFVWMISSSLKLDREVFSYPMKWIPETFRWENYSLIWQKVPLLTYFKNTAFIAIVVTLLQTLTPSPLTPSPSCSSGAGTCCSCAISPPSPCRGRPTCCPSSS